MYNLIVLLLCISIILLLLKRAKDRGPRIEIIPAGVLDKSINFLPWIFKSQSPPEGEIVTSKPKLTRGEVIMITLSGIASVCAITDFILNRITPLVKG